MEEMDYKKAFELVCNRLDYELKWTKKAIDNLRTKEKLYGFYDFHLRNMELLGRRNEIESIMIYCNKIKEHLVDTQKCEDSQDEES